MKIGDGAPILVVDDNVADLELMQICHARAGVENMLLRFDRGSVLLNHLARVKAGEQPMPALVLLDINMPQMNGFEILERVRGISEFRELPIIVFFTSSSNPRDRVRANEVGANGFRIKPSSIAGYGELFTSLAEEL